MKMKHFVLGFIFNRQKDEVLLVEKKRPEWQKGFWNGIGGKIKLDETPWDAMDREAFEETDNSFEFAHAITFVCPGGTVFVFRAIVPSTVIPFRQKEDELLTPHRIISLPKNIMPNLKWMIPLVLSTIHFPIVLQQDDLGTV